MLAGTGVILFLAGLVYPTESDDISPHFAMMSTIERFKAKWHLFSDALQIPEIKQILWFFLIVSIVAPNLEEFLVYYNAGMGLSAL